MANGIQDDELRMAVKNKWRSWKAFWKVNNKILFTFACSIRVALTLELNQGVLSQLCLSAPAVPYLCSMFPTQAPGLVFKGSFLMHFSLQPLALASFFTPSFSDGKLSNCFLSCLLRIFPFWDRSFFFFLHLFFAMNSYCFTYLIVVSLFNDHLYKTPQKRRQGFSFVYG